MWSWVLLTVMAMASQWASEQWWPAAIHHEALGKPYRAMQRHFGAVSRGPHGTGSVVWGTVISIHMDGVASSKKSFSVKVARGSITICSSFTFSASCHIRPKTGGLAFLAQKWRPYHKPQYAPIVPTRNPCPKVIISQWEIPMLLKTGQGGGNNVTIFTSLLFVTGKGDLE